MDAGGIGRAARRLWMGLALGGALALGASSAPAIATPARTSAHQHARRSQPCRRNRPAARKHHACRRRHHRRHAYRAAAARAAGKTSSRTHGATKPADSPGKPIAAAALTSSAASTTTPTPTTGSGATTSTSTTSTAGSQPSIYWGAYLGDQFTGGHPPWDWSAQTAFQNADAGGKGASLLPFGAPFYSSQWCGGYCTFPTSMFDTVRAAGMIPWFTWQTTSDYTDAQIAAGAQDTYITAWAQAAKAWGQPFFLRFDWEMNGNWFPWGVGVNGNTAASYVAMWRHVHDIFTSVGATNVSWVWCPNIDEPGTTYSPLSDLYPGDSYVDWTGLDAYNGDVPWTSFQNLIGSSYNELTAIAPSKSIVIGETGSTETGGSKAAWITSLLSVLPAQFPQIHGLLWYDISSSGPGGYTDWPIESSASAQAAFSAGIQSPAYASNNYANLDASPIPAP